MCVCVFAASESEEFFQSQTNLKAPLPDRRPRRMDGEKRHEERDHAREVVKKEKILTSAKSHRYKSRQGLAVSH